MKTVLIIAILLIADGAIAALPLDCYKAAMTDNDVLVQYKQDTMVLYPQNQENILANRVATLCTGAQTADGPIDCYKAAMADGAVLTNMKNLARGKYALQPRRDLEDAIVNMCRPANTFAPIE